MSSRGSGPLPRVPIRRHSNRVHTRWLRLGREQPDLVAVGRRAAEGWTTSAWDGLQVEDLLDLVLELQRCNRVPGAELDDPDPTLELVVVLSNRCATECRSLSDPGQAYEREVADKGQAAR